jgi:hypothetical protein
MLNTEEYFYKKIVNNILKSKNKKELSQSFWKAFQGINIDKEMFKGVKVLPKLKILILNATCNGFGDLIYALKLRNYLIDWYDADVTIVSTLEKGLLDLGADPKYVAGFSGGKKVQCRKFKGLVINKEIPRQDLIFVAPITTDYYEDLPDVKKIVPYANIFNTFTFSEYNDYSDKKFTFMTGVGKGKDGIFLTDIPDNKVKNPKLENPYALIYVAESLANVLKCVLSFVEMISKKYYKKYKNLDVIVPKWFETEPIEIENKLKSIEKYYPNIRLISNYKNEPIIYTNIEKKDKSEHTLTFRCDILPVPNKEMIQLMKGSIKDILLTGDQSITDALSCCSDKNIFYQIAPWKRAFSKGLEKELPNPHLKYIKTSCGSLKALKYRSNYSNFVRKWDFRKIAKPKMDSIVLSSVALSRNVKLKELEVLILNSKTLESLKKKIY